MNHRPYLNRYHITLCTMDESVMYLFVNIFELAAWIYHNPDEKKVRNVSSRIWRIRKLKSERRKVICTIIVGSVKYEVNLVKI